MLKLHLGESIKSNDKLFIIFICPTCGYTLKYSRLYDAVHFLKDTSYFLEPCRNDNCKNNKNIIMKKIHFSSFYDKYDNFLKELES